MAKHPDCTFQRAVTLSLHAEQCTPCLMCSKQVTGWGICVAHGGFLNQSPVIGPLEHLTTFAGSQTMSSTSSAQQQKTDEAESRDTSPDFSEPQAEVEPEAEVQSSELEGLADSPADVEPESEAATQKVQEIHYEREPAAPKKASQYEREPAVPEKASQYEREPARPQKHSQYAKEVSVPQKHKKKSG